MASTGWFLGAASWLCIIFALTSPAGAEESAREFFQPVVNHQQFTDLVRDLELDHQQRMVVQFVFDDYIDAIDALVVQADHEADAVGRQSIIEAYSGRRLLDPAELRRLRLAVLEAYRQYWPRVDQQYANLISSVRSLLTEQQAQHIDAPLRRLRRATYLHPRQIGRRSFEYAGDGLDLLQLIDQAARDGEELHGLDDALADIRRAYELNLDELLTATASSHREVDMQLRLARIERDLQAQREAEQQKLDLWRQLHDLNTRTARRIAEVAAANGQQAPDEWLKRVQQATFPWLFTTGHTDRQYEWLIRQKLTDDQHAKAAEVYQAFQERRDELRQAAIDLMLSSRTEMGRIIYAMMDQSELHSPVAVGLHQQLLRNTGELASAEAEATAGFESLLTDHQRAALRRAMRR